VAVTKDAGGSWSEPQTLNLPNPDSAVDAILLSDYRILLAFNDSVQNRENLRLAISNDRGADWVRIATLESTQGEKYSYPYMIRSQDGLIHLVYTWHRKRIKHVVFNEAWINAQMKRIAQ
jgi:predicted neuraminidase